MRLLHTSDWHLGHTLFDQPRTWEQDHFLSWLLQTLEEQAIDALLVSGDIFDTSNPSARAQSQWYEFLAAARRRMPRLQVVAIGGNHDSAGRLDAPSPLLDAFGAQVVGGAGHREIERMLVPLQVGGEVRGLVCAVPFLRPADLPPSPGAGNHSLIEGVRGVYAAILDAARERLTGGQALLAMGHCYMTGTRISELSERRILGGNEHALPADIFPEDVAYVALGHLHLPQRVGGREHVRYSGSPLALSMSEATYPHQVVILELDGPSVSGIRPVPVPRPVPVLRVPADGPAPLDEVIDLLERLQVEEPIDGAPPAWLEVRVTLDGPQPNLRERIDEAVGDKPVRLVKISSEGTGSGLSLGDAAPRRQLEDLAAGDVFTSCWARKFEGEPPPDVREAFDELTDEALRALEEAAA